MAIKVITQNPCRLSYPALFTPRAALNGGDPKYGATIIIPKSDSQTVTAISTAIQQEIAEASQPTGIWKGLNPPSPKITFYDGDAVNPRTGEAWGPEVKGCYFLRTSSTPQPDIRDEFGKKAMDATKFYAGCWCYFSINFAAFSAAGSLGVGAYLNCVMFAHDGDPLGNRADADEDFKDILARASAQPAPAAPNPMAAFGYPNPQ